MIRLTKSQFIFAQTFLCPTAVEAKNKQSTNFLNALTPIPVDRKAYKSKKCAYDQQNFFIPNVGQVKLYAYSTGSSFTINVTDTPKDPKNCKMLSVCYGCRMNTPFYFRFKADPKTTCIITPIVHFYPNRTVGIIYSCYLTSSSDQLVACMRELFQAFTRPLEHGVFSASAKFSHIHHFQDLTDLIQANITKVDASFDFSNTYVERYTTVQILDGEINRIMTQEEFKMLVCAIFNEKRVREDQFEFDVRQAWLGGEWWDYSYAAHHRFLSVENIDEELEEFDIKYQRKEGWKQFARVEYAATDRLLLQYLLNKAREIKSTILQEEKHLTASEFKLNLYDENYEQLCSQYLTAMSHLDAYTRRIVYQYYGSKENRNAMLEDTKNEVSEALEMIRNRKSIYSKILDRFSFLKGLV